MELNDKDLKKIVVMIMMALIAILTFMLLEPVILSVFGGLILAYICMPMYNKLNSFLKSRNLSASLVAIIVIAIIVIPLWFIIPIMVDQIFSLFQYSQSLDVQGFIKILFPSASNQFIVQITVAIASLISKASAASLNYLIDFFLNIPMLFFNLFVISAVFFTGMKYSESLKAFASEVSPFNKSKEKIIVSEFVGVTDSVVYGQVVVGILQGVLAGIGFILFGIKGALVWTMMAIFLSVLPLGPSIIWIPLSITFFVANKPGLGIAFLLYNILVVSLFDNLIKAYLIAKKSTLSPVIALIGIIGGIFVFGIMGIVLGPLILAYFITFLKAYREKTFSSLFAEN
ncbi:MAG: AI-2E family transporter [archaeon]